MYKFTELTDDDVRDLHVMMVNAALKIKREKIEGWEINESHTRGDVKLLSSISLRELEIKRTKNNGIVETIIVHEVGATSFENSVVEYYLNYSDDTLLNLTTSIVQTTKDDRIGLGEIEQREIISLNYDNVDDPTMPDYVIELFIKKALMEFKLAYGA